MVDFPLSFIPTARRCRELATKSPDDALRILAKHLDLPMEDAETVSFLRHAFNQTDKEIQTLELHDRIKRINAEVK